MDRGAWQATVNRIAKSQILLRMYTKSLYRPVFSTLRLLATEESMVFLARRPRLKSYICNLHSVGS